MSAGNTSSWVHPICGHTVVVEGRAPAAGAVPVPFCTECKRAENERKLGCLRQRINEVPFQGQEWLVLNQQIARVHSDLNQQAEAERLSSARGLRRNCVDFLQASAAARRAAAIIAAGSSPLVAPSSRAGSSSPAVGSLGAFSSAALSRRDSNVTTASGSSTTTSDGGVNVAQFFTPVAGRTGAVSADFAVEVNRTSPWHAASVSSSDESVQSAPSGPFESVGASVAARRGRIGSASRR